MGIALLLSTTVIAGWYLLVVRKGKEDRHFERGETQVVVVNKPGLPLTLFIAGKDLKGARIVSEFNNRSIWLRQGNYFLRAGSGDKALYYPIPLMGYRSGPEPDGVFLVTVRSPSLDRPPRLLPDSPELVPIPAGQFVLGDRLNSQDPHYVWLPAFSMAAFEVTNAEFGEFVRDATGYADDTNWTEAGRRWKSGNPSRASVLVKPGSEEYEKFASPDCPVTGVNWFEANAYCRWITRKLGKGRWLFALPSEAEWEKAARGPDNFEYGLGQVVSDAEVGFYNWKKNPIARVAVVGLAETRGTYSPNRYGLFHITGNVSEWTQTIDRRYSRRHPYQDDDRNHDETSGLRVVRGGSWYTASIAVLAIAYRENFQPEISTPYLGFRIVARDLP